MLFKKRTFNERKDRDVFCNGKMFDRKMFLIINNDKYIALNFSSIYNLKSASNLNGNLNCSKELEHYAS